jgi:hypothetical protein
MFFVQKIAKMNGATTLPLARISRPPKAASSTRSGSSQNFSRPGESEEFHDE